MADHRPSQSPGTSGRSREEETTAVNHRGAGSGPGDLPVDPDVPDPAPARARRRSHGVLVDRWDILLVIAVGGALGSLGRWAVTQGLPYDKGDFAWATALENVTGAFVLGVLMVFVLDVWPTTRYIRPFLGVGVLGGYTTFSTYMLDTRMLAVAGRIPLALGYLFGTLVTGLVAVWLGVLAGRAVAVALERRRLRRHGRSRATLERETTDSAARSNR